MKLQSHVIRRLAELWLLCPYRRRCGIHGGAYALTKFEVAIQERLGIIWVFLDVGLRLSNRSNKCLNRFWLGIDHALLRKEESVHISSQAWHISIIRANENIANSLHLSSLPNGGEKGERIDAIIA